MKLQIALPNFYGFYNSPLDDYEISEDIESFGDVTPEQYEQIDWKATHNAIGKEYLSKYWELLETELTKFGIKKMDYLRIDSPKYYNYSTDELICDVTFNKTTFRKEVKKFTKENWGQFQSFIKEKYSSRSGFYSFYTNDADEWITDLLSGDLEDNVVFEGFLEFIMQTLENDGDFENEAIEDHIVQNKSEYLEYLENA